MRNPVKYLWWLLLLSGLFIGICGAEIRCDVNVENDDDNDIGDIWDDIEDLF